MEKIVCFECGCDSEIHNHHVVPKMLGGTKTVPLCPSCHGKVHGVDFLNHKKLTKEGLVNAKNRGVKLGSPNNLTREAKMKGVQKIIQNRLSNDNWNRAKEFISKSNVKNLSTLALMLNENGYKTRKGCFYSAGTVKRLIDSIN